MSDPQLLDNVTHKAVRVNPRYAEGNGFDTNIARVFPIEFRQLATEYCLFFLRNKESGQFDPVALLGTHPQENRYLRDGQWAASHIPLSIQRQPLLIGFQEQNIDGAPEEVPVVHIDMSHPAVSTTEGEPLFMPQGGESPWLEHATSVLMAIHQSHPVNQQFSQILTGLELLESVRLEYKNADGQLDTVEGLHTINEERLSQLNGDALATLHQSGFLEAIYMIIASHGNLNKLLTAPGYA